MDEIRIELTPREQAALILLNSNELYGARTPEDAQVEDDLIGLGLAQRSNNGLQITVAGRRAVSSKITVQYPMHGKGNVSSYDKVIAGITEEAANALLCSVMNNRMIEKVPKKTMRTFFQHLLDVFAYKQMGPELIDKWQVQMNKSSNYHKQMAKKHAIKR